MATKAKKRVSVLRNEHILAFGEVFETSLTSSNLSTYALPSSHCSHLVAHGWQKYVLHLLTVMRTWRFKGYWMHAWGIHYEYVHLVVIPGGWTRVWEVAQSALQLTHSDISCVQCEVLLCWLLLSITTCMYSLIPNVTKREKWRAWCLLSAPVLIPRIPGKLYYKQTSSLH